MRGMLVTQARFLCVLLGGVCQSKPSPGAGMDGSVPTSVCGELRYTRKEKKKAAHERVCNRACTGICRLSLGTSLGRSRERDSNTANNEDQSYNGETYLSYSVLLYAPSLRFAREMTV